MSQVPEDQSSRLSPPAAAYHRYVVRFSDDSTCKAIFDHIRNLGICAAVGIAASWKYRHAAQGLLGYWDYALVGLLCALALWLFVLNQSNLIRRIIEAGVDRKLVHFFGQVYGLLAITIVASLLAPHL